MGPESPQESLHGVQPLLLTQGQFVEGGVSGVVGGVVMWVRTIFFYFPLGSYLREVMLSPPD